MLCWLRLQKAEYSYSQALGDSLPLTVANWWERRLDKTHGRYLRACESLARVRRLARPSAFQINVGEQQVNVVGGAVAE